MSDFVWLRGEQQPLAGVRIITEGAHQLALERAGKLTAVPARDVSALRHGDTPGELDHALQRMERGDFPAAERLLTPLEQRGGWLRAHAGFHRANARRLRAELEGTGHDEALGLLVAWREREGEHWLAPCAAVATGDAALVAGRHELARAEFARLAGYGEHLALASRLGLARVQLASSQDPAPAIEELEAIENDALGPGELETILLARITRAAALGSHGAANDGLDLLLPLLDTPGMVRSCWHGAALNTIATLVADLAGRAPDGSAQPHARMAASYFVNRALRYTSTQPLERARTLALAVEANGLAGRADIALMARTELGRRFPTSKYWARVR